MHQLFITSFILLLTLFYSSDVPVNLAISSYGNLLYPPPLPPLKISHCLSFLSVLVGIANMCCLIIRSILLLLSIFFSSSLSSCLLLLHAVSSSQFAQRCKHRVQDTGSTLCWCMTWSHAALSIGVYSRPMRPLRAAHERTAKINSEVELKSALNNLKHK